MTAERIAPRSEVSGKFSHIPSSPIHSSEKRRIIGKMKAMEMEIIVAYSDFSRASMKLCVENDIHLVRYVKAKIVTAPTAYGGISPDINEETMNPGINEHARKASMQRRNDVEKQNFSMPLTREG